MKGKSAHEQIVELVPQMDVQGVDWSGFNRNINRAYFRHRLDISARNIYGKL